MTEIDKLSEFTCCNSNYVFNGFILCVLFYWKTFLSIEFMSIFRKYLVRMIGSCLAEPFRWVDELCVEGRSLIKDIQRI